MSNFEHIVNQMQQHGMPIPTSNIELRVTNAKEKLSEMLSYFLSKQGRELVWLPEYEEISDWLSDSQGRGLFLFGNHGRGKSLLCRYVLPALLLCECKKVVTVLDVQAMNANIDTALLKPIVSIDDIGTEEVVNNYGNRRLAFAEIMDAAEKHNRLVIISTNLNMDSLRTVYGERTLERIKSTTRRVLFSGDSLRQ